MFKLNLVQIDAEWEGKEKERGKKKNRNQFQVWFEILTLGLHKR